MALFSALLLSSFAFACGEPSGDDAAGNEGTGNDEVNAASMDLYLRIAESKVVFDSHVESFGVKGGALDLPCRTHSWYLSSKPSLYRDAGWSPDKAADFSEDVADSKLHEYVIASCRNADTQIFGWFGKERDLEFTVPEQLLDDDYKASQLPLILQSTKIGGGAPSYYTCNGSFTKTLINETANAKHFDIAVKCKKRAAPTKGELGPIDFVKDPGPYASVASYDAWMLPPVTANKASFDKAKAALLSKVGEGKYSGAMSTLGKGCSLEVKSSGDSVVVEHTITSSNRKRTLTLKADALLGFVEGDMFADPIRVSGAPVGTFAAAEFTDDKGEPTVLRFEKNTNREGLVVRIDGSEAYCRRLVK